MRSAPLYGAFAFCTNGFVPTPAWPGGDLVAIHGTNRPELVPGAHSKGCIRVRDADVLQLRKLMPLGTPVSIV
jgi:lipoprotein-anchoring transpeptidase ErfK/SrfK